MITDFKSEELSRKVLESIRKKLLLEYRFLEPGLYRLKFKSWPGDIAATDGVNYYHAVEGTLVKFANGGEKDIELDYLHSVIHCIFLHPFTAFAASVDDRIRDIAADICVANIMCDFGIVFDTEIMNWIRYFKDKLKVLTVGSLSKYLMTCDIGEITLFEKLFKRDSHELWKNKRRNEEKNEAGNKAGNKAEKNNEGDEKNIREKNGGEVEENIQYQDKDIGESTIDKDIGETGESTIDKDTGETEESTIDKDISDSEENTIEAEEKENEHNFPDNNYEDNQIQTMEDEWKTASEKIKMDLEHFSAGKYAGDKSLSFIQNIEAAIREKVDYREFLMKFTRYEEKMKLDLDEFDYVYYSYGMNLIEKKRIALVEPLEYKDDRVIKDFVIAIDTSGSCSGDIIKNFLIKTYNILKDIEKLNESFKKINLHIIQCDCSIKEDVEINSVDDFDKYMKNFQVKGFGGTDFRPVFEHIDSLIQQKNLSSDLGGLIYFTDGYGMYPHNPPKYKTAMVFLDDDERVYDLESVPSWAIKIIINEL